MQARIQEGRPLGVFRRETQVLIQGTRKERVQRRWRFNQLKIMGVWEKTWV